MASKNEILEGTRKVAIEAIRSRPSPSRGPCFTWNNMHLFIFCYMRVFYSLSHTHHYALTGTCTHTVCPALTLSTNGAVSYSDVGSGVERDIRTVAIHTCNSGFRLEVNDAQAVGNTRTCSTDM